MTPTRAFGIAVLQRRTFGVASRLLAQNEKAAAERAAAERAAAERDMDTDGRAHDGAPTTARPKRRAWTQRDMDTEGRGHRARGVSTHRARPEDDFTSGLRRSSERRARAPVDVALTGLNDACRGAAACGVVLDLERAWEYVLSDTARVGRGESRPGRANGTSYWLSLIGWSVPETVYVSGRRGVPGAT